MNRRELLSALGLAAVANAAPPVGMPEAAGPWLFAYFRADAQVDQAAGLHLATSEDGARFDVVAGGRSLLQPQVGTERLMRDPCLFRGPGRHDPFHLVWTTGWQDTTIGHATSHDLVHWSPQRAIPVMAAFPATRNVWAPEGIWDAARRCFVLFWSSTVPGMFPPAKASSVRGMDNRIFCTTTRDFLSFTPTAVLFDPGFTVIDATFVRGPQGALHLIVKDERLDPFYKQIRIARAASPLGPFGPLSDPVTDHWSEGPTALWIGDRYRLYFDGYRSKQFSAVDSVDLDHWTPVETLRMPPGARHGTVLPIDRHMFERLRALG